MLKKGGGVAYGGQISCPGGWEGAILLVASCCRNWEKLWLLCELMLYVYSVSQVYDYWKVTLFQKVYFLFLISSTSEECKASTCSATLEAHNKAVLHSLRKLITVFNKIDTYIGVLASASKSTVERFTIECYEIKTDWKIITIAH